jgi:acyl-CoA thioesterase
MTRFDRDTAVEPRGEGVYEARIDRGWWIVVGPNGGYVGAILMRAMEHAVGDPNRAPRSVTVHYLRPPAEGPARVETQFERAGRSLTTVSARLFQDQRLLAIAIGAWSKAREAPELQQIAMPEVAPPEQSKPREQEPSHVGMRQRYDSRPAVGALPFTRSERAETGGWLRLAEPRLLDAPLAFAYADGWPPAVFSVLDRTTGGRGVPTIDLTVHFRTTLPLPNAKPDDFTLAAFRTRVVREGFLEEDGELWSRDGILIAQSRQLGLFS